MKIEKYTSFKEAIRSLTTEDQNYVFVRHTLEPGEEVRPHYHEKANEWVVIDNGALTVRVGEEERAFSLRDEPTVIHLPSGKNHSLSADSRISYFVFRDQEDKTIYYEEA